ncbi:MAG: FAD-dependent oxidoreductase, partial [Gammaproteobacteria bacterium]
EADFECSVEQRHSLLTVLVAGGGFAGVETVAAVNDFLREAIRFYPHLREEILRIVLVHAGPVILPELSPKLGAYGQRKLGARGVDIRVETQVMGVSPRGVELSDGSAVDTETVVWTAGTTPHPLLAGLPCATEHGKVPVNEYLEVTGWPGVWAVGDCALVPDGAGGYHPPTAQHALREGKRVAANIAAAIEGGRKRAFSFRTLGQLAAIGRRTGVANVFGINFSGFVAWWLWRTIYLSKLPRLERKVRVALDWSLDLLFSKDLVVVEPPRGPARSLFNEEEPPTPEPVSAAR